MYTMMIKETYVQQGMESVSSYLSIGHGIMVLSHPEYLGKQGYYFQSLSSAKTRHQFHTLSNVCSNHGNIVPLTSLHRMLYI